MTAGADPAARLARPPAAIVGATLRDQPLQGRAAQGLSPMTPAPASAGPARMIEDRPVGLDPGPGRPSRDMTTRFTPMWAWATGRKPRLPAISGRVERGPAEADLWRPAGWAG